MGKKSQVSVATGRRYVRESLALCKGYGLTEEKLKELVEELAEPFEVSWSALRQWIEFNHSKAYICTEYDEDQEVDLWFITKEGIAKDRI